MPLPPVPASSCWQLMQPPDSVSFWHAAYCVAQLFIMQGSQPVSLFGSPFVHVTMQTPGIAPPELDPLSEPESPPLLEPELLPLLEPLLDPLLDPDPLPLLEPELPPLLDPLPDPELLPLLDPLSDPEPLLLPEPPPDPELLLHPASATTSPTARAPASPHIVT